MTMTTAATNVEKWANDYYMDYVEGDFFSEFTGSGDNNIIQVIEDLAKGPGDTFHPQLINELTEGAVTGSSQLEGAEDDLSQRQFTITINQYRKAVLVPDFENKKSPVDLLNAAKAALKQWQGKFTRKRITQALSSINGVPYQTATEAQKDAYIVDNNTRHLFGALVANYSAGDHSASLLNIDATDDKLTRSTLELAKRRARFIAQPAIRPAMPRKNFKQADFYVAFCNHYQMRDLREDMETVHSNAEKRGKDNPIFAGADLVVDNMAVYEVPDMTIATGAGAAGIDVAPAFILGAQALMVAWGKRPTAITSTRDYGDKSGVGIKMWAEWAKPTFGTGASRDDDPVDHGVFTLWTASVAD